jgi:hypothetical protein
LAKLSHHSSPPTLDLLPQISLNPPQSHSVNRRFACITRYTTSLQVYYFPNLPPSPILTSSPIYSQTPPYYTPTTTSYDRSHALDTSAHPHSLTKDTHAPTRSLPYHPPFCGWKKNTDSIVTTNQPTLRPMTYPMPPNLHPHPLPTISHRLAPTVVSIQEIGSDIPSPHFPAI